MQIITRRQIIKSSIRQFISVYSGGVYGDKWDTKAKKVAALDPDACSAKELDDIIGNNSWTRCECNGCREDAEVLVPLGQEPDYESRTFYVCQSCLEKSLELLQTTRQNV